MKTSKKKKSPNKMVSYGFVGRWENGELGWCMPEHLYNNPKRTFAAEPTSDIFDKYAKDGQRAYLCKITVEQVFNKNGRAITRRNVKKDL